MANTVLLRTVLDGSKHVVVHGYLASDGVTGEITDQVVVDVSALSPAAAELVIEKVYGHIKGFNATLEFDATTDVPFMNMPDGNWFCFDFREDFGGLDDNAGTGATGDILLTTSGFSAAGDAGWFVIVARKRGATIGN